MSLGGVATWSRGTCSGGNFLLLDYCCHRKVAGPLWENGMGDPKMKCFAVTCATCAVATRYGLALVNTYKPPAFHARQERRDARGTHGGTQGDGGLTARYAVGASLSEAH